MKRSSVQALCSFRPEIERKQVSVADEKSIESEIHLERMLYTFALSFSSEEAKFDWRIIRSFEEFRELHSKLVQETIKGNMANVPEFFSEQEIEQKKPDEELEILENFLKQLSTESDACANPAFWEFLEVSPLSFDPQSKKRKEGYVEKRTGGRMVNEKKVLNCERCCRRLEKRWMLVKDNMIAYTASHTRENLNEVILFKGKFEVLYGIRDTGYSDGVRIRTLKRDMIFRAGDTRKRNEWVEAIREAYNESEFNYEELRFKSSFPVRTDNRVQWFVDGASYFSEIYKELKKAQREVFIADWWLSPELYLKRPAEKFPKSEVVEVLGELADRGVRVYVHVYKEVKFALTLDSLHTKTKLKERNPDIQVLRHPTRNVVGGSFLWSHHEKIVCIDEEICFIGGLDLCYGRFDSGEHSLVDSVENPMWPYLDYSNVRIADFTNVSDWKRDGIPRDEYPRMPWHDVALKAEGQVASDVSLHFVELWNHVMTDITGGYRRHKDLLQPINRTPTFKPIRTILEVSNEEEEEEKEIFYTQFEEIEEDNIEKVESVRITESFPEKPSLIEDVSENIDELERNFMEEIEEETIEAIPIEQAPIKPFLNNVFGIILKRQQQDKTFVMGQAPDESGAILARKRLVSDFEITHDFVEAREVQEQEDEAIEHRELEANKKEGDETWAQNLLHPHVKGFEHSGTCECQIIRSAGLWSLGLDTIENSVHTAYLHLIDKAEHFIYIENQFFISGCAGKPVRNKIAQAITNRIRMAARKNEDFKVIVCVPLLPGFEGAVDDNGAALLRVELYWEYQTISRGNNSIFKQLEDDPNIDDPSKYIEFYGLRNHGELNGMPVTEIVYIHSKLMIIDDEIFIMGSANINDRSQIGNRDSEIAMVVKDEHKVRTVIGGKEKFVSKCAHELRMHIFEEFSGAADVEILRDPLSEEFCVFWESTARNNTELYRRIFRVYPDDNILQLKEISDFECGALLEEYENRKNEFAGILVEFPMNFLLEEDLRISIFNKEFYLPDENFV